MNEQEQNMTDTRENDGWLSAVFAAAAAPVIDMAFVDRVLARMRKRQRVRALVISGAMVMAAIFILWQLAGLAALLPSFGTSLTAPTWLTASPYAPLAATFIFVGITVWMFTEEA